MEELKRMLNAIHEENKSILTLLCSDEVNTDNEIREVSKEIDDMYDELFYGKESNESINELWREN